MSGILAAIPGMFASAASAAAPVAAEAGAIGSGAMPVAAESLYSTAAPMEESFLTSGPESLVGFMSDVSPTATSLPAVAGGGNLFDYLGPISQTAGLFRSTPQYPQPGPQFSNITPEMFGRSYSKNLYDSMVAPPSYGISPLEQESVYGRQKA